MRRTHLALAVAVAIGLGSSGCTGDAPAHTTSSAETTHGCAWTAKAIHAPGRVLTADEQGDYSLVDLSTGRYLARCTPAPDGTADAFYAGYQLPSLNGHRATDNADIDGGFWAGGLRPGGADGTTVVATDGVLDLATGKRTVISVSGYRPAAVARSVVIMVRAAAVRDNVPPLGRDDWCTVAVDGSGRCTPVAGATTPGSPVVTADGSVAWLTNAMSPTSIVPPGASSRIYLRTGHRLVTATGYVHAEPGSPPTVIRDRVSPDGQSFVVLLLRSAGSTDLGSPGPVTWYTLDAAGRPRQHQATSTWADAGNAIKGGPGTGLVGDVSVSADGATLYALIRHGDDVGLALVAIPQRGRPRLMFDTSPVSAGPRRGEYAHYGDHLLSAPSPPTS